MSLLSGFEPWKTSVWKKIVMFLLFFKLFLNLAIQKYIQLGRVKFCSNFWNCKKIIFLNDFKKRTYIKTLNKEKIRHMPGFFRLWCWHHTVSRGDRWPITRWCDGKPQETKGHTIIIIVITPIKVWNNTDYRLGRQRPYYTRRKFYKRECL